MAWRPGELSQQPTWPHDVQIRRCTQSRRLANRHSRQPREEGSTGCMKPRWAQVSAMDQTFRPPTVRMAAFASMTGRHRRETTRIRSSLRAHCRNRARLNRETAPYRGESDHEKMAEGSEVRPEGVNISLNLAGGLLLGRPTWLAIVHGGGGRLRAAGQLGRRPPAPTVGGGKASLTWWWRADPERYDRRRFLLHQRTAS